MIGAIHSLETTKRPSISLVPPVIGRLKYRFEPDAKLIHRCTGKKVTLQHFEVHPLVMDMRHIFREQLETRFEERVGHEEDILVATALDPR